MADLFARLARRTLAERPALWPVDPGPLALGPPEEEESGEILVPPAADSPPEARTERSREPEAGGPDSSPEARRRPAEPSVSPPASRTRRSLQADPDAPKSPRESWRGESSPVPVSPRSQPPSGRTSPPTHARRTPKRRPGRPEREEDSTVLRRPDPTTLEPARPAGRSAEAWEAPPLVQRSTLPSPTSPREATPAAPRGDVARRGSQPPGETTVHVTIGRIEVRGPEPSLPENSSRPWSEGPMLTLGEYLARRGQAPS